MFQTTPQESWVAQHIWQIVEFLALFAAVVGAWFSLRGEVQQLKLDRDDACERIARVEMHITDTARHRDPERDERRLQGIENGIAEILRELRQAPAGARRVDKS